MENFKSDLVSLEPCIFLKLVLNFSDPDVEYSYIIMMFISYKHYSY